MASCKSKGGLKVRHPDRASAEKHALAHQKGTNHKISVYRCPKCMYWHVGRHKTLKAHKQFTESSRNKKEEIQVGILIGALKSILNKEA